jgi:tRNA U38,U39,U40 pseudouridine synthase TruA
LGGNQDTEEVRLFCLTTGLMLESTATHESTSIFFLRLCWIREPLVLISQMLQVLEEGIYNLAPRENIPSLSMDGRKNFRCAANDLETLRRFLTQFHGLHKFHNYSSGFSPLSADAKRYIIDSTCDLIVIEGQEFVRVRLHGQSFILNQIRKMVCLNY